MFFKLKYNLSLSRITVVGLVVIAAITALISFPDNILSWDTFG